MDILEVDYTSKNQFLPEKEQDKYKKVVQKQKKTFVHINSSFRNKNPSNVLDEKIYTLTNNPLTFIKNSNLIKIFFENHPFTEGDEIVIDNVSSDSLTGNFQLVYSNFYLIISSTDPSSKESLFLTQLIHSYTPNMQILISDLEGDDNYLTDVDKKYLFGVIPLNNINTIFNFEVENDTIKIKLPYEIPSSSKTPSGIRSFTVTSLNIWGIPLRELNANFPLDSYHSKGFHLVVKSEQNYFYVLSNTSAVMKETVNTGGKDKIKVAKVINRIIAYPQPSFYQIPLEVTYQNVSKIEVFSSEIPYTIKTITSYNNNLYLKFLSTASTIYKVTLTEGFFDEKTILDNLVNSLNALFPGKTSNSYLFEVSFSQSLFFTISAYKSFILYQPFSTDSNFGSVSILNKVLKINIPFHNLVTGDSIEIRNAVSFYGIPSSVINSVYTVTVVDTNTLTITLPNYNTEPTTQSINNGGGNSVQFLLPNPVQVLSGNNSINDLLGLKISTAYTNKIENLTPIKIYPSYYLELRCYVNNFIDRTNYLLTKIQLDGSRGSYLYNTHTQCYLEFDPPIKNLASLLFMYTFANGAEVDFFDYDNSLTIQITENYYVKVDDHTLSETTNQAHRNKV